MIARQKSRDSDGRTHPPRRGEERQTHQFGMKPISGHLRPVLAYNKPPARHGLAWCRDGKEDALKILQAKLAEIEQDHDLELEDEDEPREPINAKAEARTVTAIFDFLQDCKIVPTESLLRVFRRYLYGTKTHTPITEQRRQPRSRASKRGLLQALQRASSAWSLSLTELARAPASQRPTKAFKHI
jgi:hypothetical protein